MKAAELVEMDNDSLVGKLKDSRRELYELRFKLAVGQLDDHRQIRNVRLDIARIMTSLRQRELGLATEPGAGDPIAAQKAPAQIKAQEVKAPEVKAQEVETQEAEAAPIKKAVGAAARTSTTRGKAVTKTVTRRVGKTVSKTAKAASKTAGRPSRATARKTAVRKAASKKTSEETE